MFFKIKPGSYEKDNVKYFSLLTSNKKNNKLLTL